jgi:NADPH:quinone reductase-like Zn-dependent oxidoreductase
MTLYNESHRAAPEIAKKPKKGEINMKAVRIHGYGSSDVLVYEDAPRPTAKEGEVLIRNYATTVNPFDCAVRAGYMAGYINYTFPLILGTDVSGVVEEVGPESRVLRQEITCMPEPA